jgi:Mn2+/Fe2+ NRAMP family transporter
MGQDYGMKLLCPLILLSPILFFCQEMVVRARRGIRGRARQADI